MAKQLLVVDDDASLLLAISDTLRAEGYEVVTARRGAEALVRVAEAARPRTEADEGSQRLPFERTPEDFRADELGVEHSRDVLRELGYTQAEVDDLYARKVVA